MYIFSKNESKARWDGLMIFISFSYKKESNLMLLPFAILW